MGIIATPASDSVRIFLRLIPAANLETRIRKGENLPPGEIREGALPTLGGFAFMACLTFGFGLSTRACQGGGKGEKKERKGGEGRCGGR